MNVIDDLFEDRVSGLGMSDPVIVAPGDTIAAVIALMQRERVGYVVVMEGDVLRGVFTERDVLKHLLATGVPNTARIDSVMTHKPQTLSLAETVSDVIRKMHEGGFRHLPVLDEHGKVAGIVSVKRVVQYLVEHFPEAVYNLPPEPASVLTSREGG